MLAFAQTSARSGGAPISSYQLACQPGNQTTQGSGSPLGFSGLVNGTAYSCGLAAITGYGIGTIAAFSATPADESRRHPLQRVRTFRFFRALIRWRDGDHQLHLALPAGQPEHRDRRIVAVGAQRAQ